MNLFRSHLPRPCLFAGLFTLVALGAFGAVCGALVLAKAAHTFMERMGNDDSPKNDLRFALNQAEFHCDDRIACFSLTLADAARLAVLPEDNEGIIDNLRSIEGVQAAIFFEELPEEKVRVSARSKDPAIDVCKICQMFKGGGHPMASGARVRGTLEKVREDFLKAVSDEIRKRD